MNFLGILTLLLAIFAGIEACDYASSLSCCGTHVDFIINSYKRTSLYITINPQKRARDICCHMKHVELCLLRENGCRNFYTNFVVNLYDSLSNDNVDCREYVRSPCPGISKPNEMQPITFIINRAKEYIPRIPNAPKLPDIPMVPSLNTIFGTIRSSAGKVIQNVLPTIYADTVTEPGQVFEEVAALPTDSTLSFGEETAVICDDEEATTPAFLEGETLTEATVVTQKPRRCTAARGIPAVKPTGAVEVVTVPVLGPMEVITTTAKPAIKPKPLRGCESPNQAKNVKEKDPVPSQPESDNKNEIPVVSKVKTPVSIGCASNKDVTAGLDSEEETPARAEPKEGNPETAGSAEENPATAEEKPVAANSAEEKPVAANSAEEKPVAVNSAEEKPVATNSAEEKPLAVNSAEEKPVAVNSAEEKPVAVNSAKEKPVATNSAEEKPVAASSAEENPATGGSAEEKPATANSAEEKTVAEGSTEEKPATGGSAEENTATVNSGEEKPAAGGSAEENPAVAGSAEENQAKAGSGEATANEDNSKENGETGCSSKIKEDNSEEEKSPSENQPSKPKCNQEPTKEGSDSKNTKESSQDEKPSCSHGDEHKAGHSCHEDKPATPEEQKGACCLGKYLQPCAERISKCHHLYQALHDFMVKYDCFNLDQMNSCFQNPETPTKPKSRKQSSEEVDEEAEPPRKVQKPSRPFLGGLIPKDYGMDVFGRATDRLGNRRFKVHKKESSEEIETDD